MSNTILRVTIGGRVQGVGYRAWVEHDDPRMQGGLLMDDGVDDLVVLLELGPGHGR